jgi:hypothetical protein
LVKRLSKASAVASLFLIGETPGTTQCPPSGAAKFPGLSEVALGLRGGDLNI